MILKNRKFKEFKKEEYTIRNDAVFKIVFGSNERSHLLKNFLEAILHRKITNIVVRNEVALNRIHAEDKFGKLDLLVEVDGKEKINIELQNKNEYNIIKRGEFYGSGIYYTSLKEGENYQENLKTVVIMILGYNLFKDGPYHEIGNIRRTSNNEILTDDITYHYIQLPRFIEQVREVKTGEEQWLSYISCQLNKEELEELYKMNRSIEEINKIVDIVLEDKDVYDELNRRIFEKYDEMIKLHYAEEKGMEKGMEKGIIEIAKKMLEKNKPIEEIIEFTGLTKEELEKIQI